MITKISSGNYDIISSGYSFFYTDEFSIDLYNDNNEKDITIIIDLVRDDNIDSVDIHKKAVGNELHIKCINFLKNYDKNGIIRPINIAQDMNTGKKLYLMFYIQREGNAGCMRTNSIKYTVFKER